MKIYVKCNGNEGFVIIMVGDMKIVLKSYGGMQDIYVYIVEVDF